MIDHKTTEIMAILEKYSVEYRMYNDDVKRFQAEMLLEGKLGAILDPIMLENAKFYEEILWHLWARTNLK